MKHVPIWGGTCSEGDSLLPVIYDIANDQLMGQFDGVGGISKYSVAGKWKIVKEGSWYTGWTINGLPMPLTLTKQVICMGKKQKMIYETFTGTRMTVELFSHPSENLLFAQYEVKNEGAESIQFDMHVGFEVDMISYHMEKLRQRGETKQVGTSFRAVDQRYFEFQLDEDYIVHVASNEATSLALNEENRLNLHHTITVLPGETKQIVWLLSAANPGYDQARADADLAQVREYSSDVDATNAWLQDAFHSEDDELNALYGYSLNASLSSYKQLGQEFAAYFAGIDYQSPPRTYFRDGYWTVLPSLPYHPARVRGQILTLAKGIGTDGECPSAVIYNQESGKYEPFWPDHFDSPSFFVLMIHDYLAWTHDFQLLDELVNGRSIRMHMENSLDYLIRHTDSGTGSSLAKKPDNRRDWVDNVYREGDVLYNLALYCRALDGAEQVFKVIGDADDKADYYGNLHRTVVNELQKLIRENGYFNYKNSNGFVEPNMSIELSLLIVFDLLAPADATALLGRMATQLETRNNSEQQYGDWGVMTVFPFYRQVHHQVEKSMSPYRYHNGGDWPYMDGIYALAKLKSGDAEWRYPLTRWFQVSMDNGWLTPVEYYGPLYGKGSNLQGWSSMPAAAMLMGGVGLVPRLDEVKVALKVPPWGNFTMKHIHFRGRVYDIAYQDGVWTIEAEDGAREHPFVV